MLEIDSLFSTTTVRARAHALLARARSGASAHFAVHDGAMDACAQTVARVTRERYPDLNIPYHSRWRHFEPGGVNRRFWLDEIRPGAANEPVVLIDLVMVSVLLDAGAGAAWKFVEARTGQTLTRSEGLGVASLSAFTSGLFSADPRDPLRCDAAALIALTPDRLGAAFQANAENPLLGLDGRCALLKRLGQAMADQPQVFEAFGSVRAGNLYFAVDLSRPIDIRNQVKAHDILSVLLKTLTRIWPSGGDFGGEPVGDCWPHPALGSADSPVGWQPFHKLSQWLTYSLLEPFEWSGVRVVDLDALTGLPEYRNGGLLLDTGVLSLKDASAPQHCFKPSDELVIEWRGLTVALLDELHLKVAKLLGKTPTELPLACVLEGGTWAAGRVLAQALRGGLPPLKIDSDGTVF